MNDPPVRPRAMRVGAIIVQKPLSCDANEGDRQGYRIRHGCPQTIPSPRAPPCSRTAGRIYSVTSAVVPGWYVRFSFNTEDTRGPRWATEVWLYGGDEPSSAIRPTLGVAVLNSDSVAHRGPRVSSVLNPLSARAAMTVANPLPRTTAPPPSGCHRSLP